MLDEKQRMKFVLWRLPGHWVHSS